MRLAGLLRRLRLGVRRQLGLVMARGNARPQSGEVKLAAGSQIGR